MKTRRKPPRKPIPIIPASLFAAVALFNLFGVRTVRGAEFLYLLLWALCAFFAAYAAVSFLELRLKGRLKSVCRWLRRTAQVCAVAGLAFFITVQCFITFGAKSTAEPGADYVIVMGAGLINGVKPTTVLISRLEAAYNYIGGDAVIIVSGGQGGDERVTEAYAMSEYLIGKGVEPSRILLEDRARNSRENLTFSGEMIPEGASAVIVTNEFHIYRCEKLAARCGLKNYSMLAAPTPGFLRRASCQMREFFSVTLMWFGLKAD